MATGTTLTISTRGDKDYRGAVAATDAGSPSAGSPTFIYDDGESQASLIRALEAAKAYVLANVTTR